MSVIDRTISGAVVGGLVGMAVGAVSAGIFLAADLPFQFPLDRWKIATSVATLLVVSGSVIGLVTGFSSKIPEHGVPLAKSIMLVVSGGIAGIIVVDCAGAEELLVVGALVGVLFGGALVAVVGIVKRGNADHESRIGGQAEQDSDRL